ncbi:Receptor activity-modifying protein 1 [Acipenser ruthenus]|uniref:Receptor activity-modifying protein 1 n=1 Tax=Acipenser ruthenus TaxID=7906 RepID=A0A444UGE6_ACIRT|nr:Receptor activity-modifying protein 1 [Acipenser ruthenus]
MLPDSIQNQHYKEDKCASGDFRRAAEPVELSQARNMPSSASLERSDAFHSACDRTAAEDIEEAFCTLPVSAEKQTQDSLNLELLQETSVEASLPLDIELEMHQQNAHSMQGSGCWDKNKADFEARGLREAETYSSVPGYQELEKETLPDYYSFSSTGFYEVERDASSGPQCMSSDTESRATADPLGDTPEEGCYKTSEKCSNAALEESKGCDSQCTSSLDDWPDGTSFSEYGYGSEGDPENDQNFEVYHSIAEGTSFTAEQDELQTESAPPACLRRDHCLPVPDAHHFISVTACDEAFYSHAIEEYCLSKFKFDMDALGQRYWCEWEETVGKFNTLALACPDLVTHFSVLCLALNSVLEDMCSLPDRLQSCSWSEDILTQRRGCETQHAYSGLLSETETKLTSPLQSIDSSHTTVNMSVGSTQPGSADLTSVRSYGELTNCTFLIAEKLECYWPNRLVDEFFIGIHKLYFRNCSLSGRSLSDPPNSVLGPFIVVPILVTLLVTALVVWCSKRSEGII